MNQRPTHGSAAGRTYLALQKKARDDGRATDELLRLAVLEAFVDRMTSSPRAHDLVLKGGVLLAAYDVRRPTRDVDLAARGMPNEPNVVADVVDEILAVDRDDGWLFGATSTEVIREQDAYSGVRVTVPCALASAKFSFNVDVNVGDVISPPPVDVALPRLLGGEIRTKGYALSMVLAEKIVTALQRTTINTRWRDFADVLLLSRAHPFIGVQLVGSVVAVAEHRGAVLRPLSHALFGFAPLGQARWAAWVRKERLVARLPLDFAEVLAQVAAFADPLLSGRATGAAWTPEARTWG